MANKRPPLTLLNTFEAAGRLGSFKAAANELNVTPSAISHQIKTLEEHLNFQLFRRKNRALTLTDAGTALLHSVSTNLSALKQEVDHIQRRFGHPSIRAHILPFQATDIVIPNLHHFQAANPDVELRIETSLYGGGVDLGDVDIGIKLSENGSFPGLESDLLLNISVSPVCSPTFQAENNLWEFKDLLGQTLIHIPYGENAWRRWADTVELEGLDTKEALTIDSFASNLGAAEQGLGVALGIFPLVTQRIKQGRLVSLFDHRIEVDEAYYLVYRTEDAKRPDIQAFKQWLLELFAQLQQESDEFFSPEPPK